MNESKNSGNDKKLKKDPSRLKDFNSAYIATVEKMYFDQG